ILEQARWVIRTDDGSLENQRHASWAISQQLGVMFKEYREERCRARQRQLDDIYSASKSPIPKAVGFEYLADQ
ncbi:hypothetical protein, partial [Streptococcus pneumoniae]|uniref:hypothetical protein n=1 Tax=Streptococcus pneumoniae TaxID=1313 RepID=UPI001E4D6B30